MQISVIFGDITRVEIEALVNAANSTLLGGGGVDGAIHRAAGKELLEECKRISRRQGGCKTGEAVITAGYNLKAKYVIHTVGPVWNNGKSNEPELLQNCYKNAMRIAHENNIQSIAFPNISTGVYGFPKALAAEIVSKYFHQLQKTETKINKVVFVCFDQENYTLYADKFKA
ncbi:MAG: O-acetyl-ADP-ribose deacetylase [Chloroflexi bacterium HGW-Chloroflexi-10]|nr:MAG: O-acetyl-ADP-ribose deacetylase [Chloroflexi bacterium HGW-Chloroflexi-10]